MPRPEQCRGYPLMILIFSLLLRLSASTDALTLPGDVAALKAFKAGVDPATIPPSSCLDSWDFSSGSDPCAVPKRTHFICGLTCSPGPTPRVVAITLDSVGYSGRLTPLISGLTQLVTLDLGQNSFHGPIPPSLSSLSLLQSLSLRQNYFSGPVPASLSSLRSLTDLDLSGNSLSGPLPTTLSSLSRLTRLDLSFNGLTGPIPKLPPNLLEFAAKSNSLSGPIPRPSFDGLNLLETVELGSNALTGAAPAWFFALPSLQQADLSNNTLTRVDIWRPPRGSYSQLVAVDLGFNRIEGSIPASFSEYPSLASLSLRYNRLRGPIPSEFGRKGSLRRLYLDGNYLTGTPPAGFFAGKESPVAGSFGDNCLRGCPPKSQLCLPSQKPVALCKQVYGGKKH